VSHLRTQPDIHFSAIILGQHPGFKSFELASAEPVTFSPHLARFSRFGKLSLPPGKSYSSRACLFAWRARK